MLFDTETIGARGLSESMPSNWLQGTSSLQPQKRQNGSSIHSSIHFNTCLIQSGARGGWSLSQLPLDKSKGTPSGCQSITGPHREKQPCTLTLIPWVDLKSPVNLTCMFLKGGRKLEYTEGKDNYSHSIKLSKCWQCLHQMFKQCMQLPFQERK